LRDPFCYFGLAKRVPFPKRFQESIQCLHDAQELRHEAIATAYLGTDARPEDVASRMHEATSDEEATKDK
jgi:hypothetical protein